MMSMGPGNPREIVRVRDSEADSVFRFVNQIFGPHDLSIHDKGDLRFGYVGNARPSAEMSVGHLQYGTPVTVHLGAAVQHYTVTLPVQGSLVAYESGKRCLSGADRALVLSPGRDTTIDLDPLWRSIFVTMSARLVDLELRKLIGKPIHQPLVFENEMPMEGGYAASWWRAANYYLNELSEASGIALHPSVGSEFERTLIRALIVSQPSNYSLDIQRTLDENTPHYVLRAKLFIEENYSSELRLEVIGASCGAPSAKLFAGFKEYVGTSPMGYLRRVRLDKAREQLLKSDNRRHISSVAFDVGFNHLGRFSVEYKKAFGESPTDTSARSQGGKRAKDRAIAPHAAPV